MPFDFSTRRNISPTEQGGAPAVLIPTTIPPSVVSQTVYPPEGCDGFNEVSVPGVTAAIDPNITPANIVKGCNILGVVGESSAVAPKEFARYMVRDNGEVDVSDKNLTGVFNDIKTVGNYAFYGAFSNSNVTGDISFPNCNYIYNNSFANAFCNTNITSVSFPNQIYLHYAPSGFERCFYGCKNLTSVNLNLGYAGIRNVFAGAFIGCSNLTDVNINFSYPGGISIFQNAFTSCSNLTHINFSFVNNSSYENQFTGAFSYCSNLIDADFSNLTNISSTNGFSYTFSGCTNLTKVYFSNLYSISVSTFNTLSGIFSGCTNFTQGDVFSSLYLVTSSRTGNTNIFANAFRGTGDIENFEFSNLATARGTNVFNWAFANSNIKNLRFPGLFETNQSTVFGSYMLRNVSDCMVHFPKNKESEMSSWSHVISGFGGTNTVVLFDLPNTDINAQNIGYYNISESGIIGENNFAVGASSNCDNAWLAFTTNNNTGWQSSSEEIIRYFDIYFPESSALREIDFNTYNSVNMITNAPTFINICTSDDGVDWIQQSASFSTPINSSSYIEKRIILSSPRFYKYYRIYFNSYNNDSSYVTTINSTYINGVFRYITE